MEPYKKGKGRKKEERERPVMTKQRLAQTRVGLCDPGTGEPEQMASAAEGTLEEGTRRAATSTDYGGASRHGRRRRTDDGEAEQTRRARRGREQDVAEISRRMWEIKRD